MEEFKYSHVNRLFDAASATLHTLCQSIVIKKLSCKEKFSVNGLSMFVLLSLITNWPVTKITVLNTSCQNSFSAQGDKFSFPGKTQTKASTLHSEMSQLKWFMYLVRMSPARLPWEASRYVLLGETPEEDPGHGRETVFRLAWECLGILPEKLEEVVMENVDLDLPAQAAALMS